MSEITWLEGQQLRKTYAATQEQQLNAEICISLETEPHAVGTVRHVMQSEPATFFRELRKLPRMDQDLLLMYLLLEPLQEVIGDLFKMQQQALSSQLREALQVMGANLLFKDFPEALILKVLKKCKVTKPEKTTEMLKCFLDTADLKVVWEWTGERASRNIHNIAVQLAASGDAMGEALGAKIQHTLEFAKNDGKVKQRKLFDVFKQDPSYLGEFRIAIEENPDHLFQRKADGLHNESE
jgi:hypothetical protein